MAIIPLGDNLGKQTPQLNRGVNTAPGQTAGFDAIAQLGKIGADIAIQVDKNERALKTAGNSTAALREVQEYWFTMKTEDRDYATQFKRYEAFATDVVGRYKDTFKDDPAGYSVFQKNVGEAVFKQGFEVRQHSLNGQMDLQKGGLDATLQQMSELAIQGDDEQRAMIETKANLLLQDSYQNGVLTAEETVKQQQRFKDDLVGATVRRDILNDPDSAIGKILKGEYGGLSSEKQMIWLERANTASESKVRKELAEENRLRLEQERSEKIIQENLSKAGDKMLSTGELTADWIDANADDMADEDVRYFYRKLSGGDEGNTDKTVYSDLRMRASNGEDVREDARVQLRKGLLKGTDYDKLVTRSEDNVGISNLPNVFKRGEQFIAKALQVSDMNPDPAAAQRLANAMDDWSQWTQDNKEATDAEARDAYKRITSEYALIDYEQMSLTKRLPRFTVGNRQNMDVAATKLATAAALQNGEISRDEAEKQLLLINEWDAAIQRLNVGK